MSPLNHDDHVVVVGAGLAGWRFAEILRQLGFRGAVTMVGDESRAPYDRPPLSKQILSGKWTLDKATLATPSKLGLADVELLLGRRAVRLDADARRVELDDGTMLSGTHVVVATGTRARRLSFAGSGALPTLRTADDVTQLNERISRLEPGAAVAVIGGGFVGAEVATSLAARGLRPVVLEAAERPLVGVVGEEASDWLARLAPAADIELRTHQHIRDVLSADQRFYVEFDEGPALEVGAVLAAVGSALDLAWLDDSGLHLDEGVHVDENLQAAPQVAAIGDVARFAYRGGNEREHIRVEHWQVAADHAWHLAHHWMGEAVEPAVPYFWSDQYGKKIQMLGHPHAQDEVVRVSGSDEELKWLALYARNGLVTGILALSNPRGLATSKVLLDEITTIDDALSRTPWAS
ncbi:MAG TPA: FAD-dependent oxidoreductase [Acidimicrobiales bacterium]|nr:FAD-dependent oxidoreductase [Acidimicrobiales bacterium]